MPDSRFTKGWDPEIRDLFKKKKAFNPTETTWSRSSATETDAKPLRSKKKRRKSDQFYRLLILSCAAWGWHPNPR